MGDELSPLEAAAAIRSVEGWDTSLRHRTTGLVWMAWGFVFAGIAMTYAFATATVKDMPPWFGLLWVAWAAPGIAFTALQWRSARLTAGLGLSGKSLAGHALAFFLATVGMIAIVKALHLPLFPPSVAISGIGILVGVFGIGRFLRRQPIEGSAMITAGIILLGTGILEFLLLRGLDYLEGVEQSALINAAVGGVTILLVGLVLYRRA
jgi:hypothetical protein